VSSIGSNLKENLDALLRGEAGIGPTRLLETIHRDTLPVGEVALDNGELMDRLALSRASASDWSRTALLGLMAAREAYKMAGCSRDDGINTALVSASTVGGMDRTEVELSKKDRDPSFIHTHACGDHADRIAAELGIGGYRTALSTACSSGANALMHGARLIRSGRAQRVLVGGVDALSRFTLNGFSSLMILDSEPCRPFDRSRRGLNLGEGAGFLLLEAEELALKHPSRILARLSGYANTNDAYHQTASSPEGNAAYGAMKEALVSAGLQVGDVDYINVHGTGTENNDASEGTAIRRLFGDIPPALSSTKSFTGHTLGAAAGVEAVFSVLAIREGLIPPSLRFSEPMEGLDLKPSVEKGRRADLSVVLSNSFGFGGNNSSLCFTAP